MRSFILFLALAVGSIAAPPKPPPATSKYGLEYLKLMTDTHMRNGVVPSGHYDQAVVYQGFQMAYELTGDDKYFDFVKSQLEGHVVADNGSLVGWTGRYSLDGYRIGMNMLWMYKETGEEKWKTAAEIIRKNLETHPRTPSGGYWHRIEVYPDQMWLDGIFMADSFYATYTSVFDKNNATAWNDIALQYHLIEQHCRDKKSGLLAHGYDESKTAVWADPITGAAPHAWDRAIGWYYMSLLETLEVFPKKNPNYKKLVHYFTTLSEALKKHQDKTGGWWLIMDGPYPGQPGNYIETSGTAMFTYGMLKGMRMGYISKKKFLPTARTAYEYTVEEKVKLESNGTITLQGTNEVGSLGGNGTYEVSQNNIQPKIVMFQQY